MAYEGEKWAGIVQMTTVLCCECGAPFGMPSSTQEYFSNNPQKSFCCPYGHKQHYTQSKIKRELSEAKARVAELEITASRLDSVYKGVCPYCNRKYTNLTQHIQNRHAHLVNL